MGLTEIVSRAVVSSLIAVSGVVSGFALPQPTPAAAFSRASSSVSITEAQCLTSNRKFGYSANLAAVEVLKVFNDRLIRYTNFKLPDGVYCHQAFGATDGNVVTAVNARNNSSGSVLVSTVEGDALIIATHDRGHIMESVLLRALSLGGYAQPSDYLLVIAERDEQPVLTVFQITGEGIAIVADNRVLDLPVSGVEVSGLGYMHRPGDVSLSLDIRVPMKGINGGYIGRQGIAVSLLDVLATQPGMPLFGILFNEPLGARLGPLSYAQSSAQNTSQPGWVIKNVVAPERGLE